MSDDHGRRPRRLTTSLLCLILGLVGALPLIVLTPPLQVADEAQHFFRAYQLSELRIWSRVEDGRVGDDLPVSLGAFTEHFLGTTKEHADRPVTHQPLAATFKERARPLAPAVRGFTPFQGAAFYSPLPYIPQVLAIRLGRLFDAGPLMLFYAGRLANALAALALLATAVRIAPFGKEMLFISGLLPMALYQYASLSPDAMVIGCAFLFGAISLRAQARGRWRVAEIVTAIVTGTVFCSLKPVYLPLLLLGLVPDIFDDGRRARALGTHLVIVVCVTAATWIWMRSTASVLVLLRPGTSLHDQAAFILAHPLAYARIIGTTLTTNASLYFKTTIGVFGWVTIVPPRILYFMPVAAAVIVLIGRGDGGAPVSRAAALWQMSLALACGLLVMTSLYLIWTPVGATVIEGVQGRYFLPALGAAAVAGSSLWPLKPSMQPVPRALVATTLFCIGLAQLVLSDLTIIGTYAVF